MISLFFWLPSLFTAAHQLSVIPLTCLEPPWSCFSRNVTQLGAGYSGWLDGGEKGWAEGRRGERERQFTAPVGSWLPPTGTFLILFCLHLYQEMLQPLVLRAGDGPEEDVKAHSSLETRGLGTLSEDSSFQATAHLAWELKRKCPHNPQHRNYCSLDSCSFSPRN